jgi:MinD superfamily P-loop ATPase
MKQLLILSGKGGTGKTTLASAFIKLADAKVYADCDVDAPNLHLLMGQSSKPKRTDYYGLPKAEIDQEFCIKCDLCRQFCRFDAINENQEYQVDSYACEGCGVCEAVCPANAISLKPALAGELMLYSDANRVFSTAQLKMGSGTSGMLVTEVKKQMKSVIVDTNLAVIDGSPGIGCPVETSVSTATRPNGSLLIMASRIESEIRSATLSGCPSVTDSDVKNCLPNDYRSCHLLFCFVSVFLMYGFQGTNIYTRCAIYADFFIDDSFIIN